MISHLRNTKMKSREDFRESIFKLQIIYFANQIYQFIFHMNISEMLTFKFIKFTFQYENKRKEKYNKIF